MHLFLKANHYSREDNRCVFQFARAQFQCYILHAEYYNTDNKRHHKGAQKTLLHPGVSIADSCGGFNTRCIIAKGIKSDCNHLMRTTPRRSASGLLISFQRNDIFCFLFCYFLHDFFLTAHRIYSNNHTF